MYLNKVHGEPPLKKHVDVIWLLALPQHNSASEMFVNLNILSFGELLRKFVYSFQSRLIISDNILLSGIFNSTTPLYSPIWAWWHTILRI